MPKRNGGRQNYNNNNSGSSSSSRYSSLKDYIEHDDRTEHRNKDRNTRRVSFKPSLFQNNGIKRSNAELGIRQRLEDDDDMGDLQTTKSYEPAPRRKGSPLPKGKFGNFRKLEPSQFGWYLVAIKNGHIYSKDDVIRAILQAISPDIFIPHYWRIERNGVLFFVDDFHIAERLQSKERNIQMPDGFRLMTRVRPGIPQIPVDDAFKEKMKMVMAKRYNPQMRALDLSKFHADVDLKDTFCGIFRPNVMSAALDIIEKNIPEIEALNLNNNCITTMESFKNVAARLPNLKILYLGDNKIPSLAHLLVLRNVPITELFLKTNPLRNRYANQSFYVSEVRRKFPKLTKLDGVELEPLILFDVNDTTSTLPQPKASYLCDIAGADIIRQFLEQYFLIFDSDNRQPLLDAYHEQAMMSISVPSVSEAGRLTSFWKFNRNLIRVVKHEEATRIRQLKVGRLAVVSSLAEWPKTKHDPQSFSVDLTLFTPQLISFTVAGLFKETESQNRSNGDVRHFQRHFVIVPAGSGFCIRNELIFVTNATTAEARAFMRPSPATTASSTATSTITSGSSGLQGRLQQNMPSTSAVSIQLPTNAKPPMPDEATQMQMVQAIAAQTNMSLTYSKKCLDETGWDFERALGVFQQLHKLNQIPPEAFIK